MIVGPHAPDGLDCKMAKKKLSGKIKSSVHDKKHYTIFGTALVVILLDQLTKLWAANSLQNPMVFIENIFQFVLVKNTGASFGLFKDTNTLLIFLSLMVLGVVLYFYDKIPKTIGAYIAVGLILGGGIGNLIDRIRLDHVIDFIDVGIWPTFNIADSAITIGVILFLWFGWRDS